MDGSLMLLSGAFRLVKWLLTEQEKADEKGDYLNLEGKPWDQLSEEQKESKRRMFYNDPMGGHPPPRD